MGPWWRAAAGSVNAGILLLAVPAAAGSIAISVSTSAAMRNSGLAVAARVANSGSESAESVHVTLSFAGHVRSGRVHRRLPPGGSFAEELAVPASVPPGRWPYEVRVDYADPHHYAFQALQVGLVSTGGVPPPSIRLDSVGAGAVARSGVVRVRVVNTGKGARRVAATVVVPRELGPPQRARWVTLAGGEKKTLEISISNRGALPGSRYPVFAVLEYDEGGLHQAVIGRAIVAVVAPQAFLVRWRHQLWAGAAGLVAIWAALGAGWLVRRCSSTRGQCPPA